jgi:hypothetical protein
MAQSESSKTTQDHDKNTQLGRRPNTIPCKVAANFSRATEEQSKVEAIRRRQVPAASEYCG